MKYLSTKIITIAIILGSTLFVHSAIALEYQGRLLRLNTVGSDVKALQQCLLDMGFPLPLHGADGHYGQETYTQITSYQRANGLEKIDGIVGPVTAAELTCTKVAAPVVNADLADKILPDDIDATLMSDTDTDTETGSIGDTELIEELAKAKETKEKLREQKEKSDEKKKKKKKSTLPKQKSSRVKSAVKLFSNSGPENDYAEYVIDFGLNAFGNRSYLSEDRTESIDFSIIRSSDGTLVYKTDGSVEAGSISYSIDSQADLENNFYRLDENGSERFILNISYNPYEGTSAGPGAYRVQIDSINYRVGSINSSLVKFNTSSLSKFRTKSVIITD